MEHFSGKKLDKLSLLVQSCDKYEWFWSGIFCTLDFYWDFNYPVYFSTEEKNIHEISYHFNPLYKPNPNIKLINHKGCQEVSKFSDRMIASLNQIDSKYVLYIQEDMWLRRSLDSELIDKLVQFMEDNEADSLRIHSKLFYWEKYYIEPTEFIVDGIRLMKMEEREDNFFLTHGATIWRKDYLIKHQKEGEDPWTNEWQGSKRMFDEPKNHYLYNIHWHCQPGVAEKGELSGEGPAYAHIIWEMMNLNLTFNILAGQ